MSETCKVPAAIYYLRNPASGFVTEDISQEIVDGGSLSRAIFDLIDRNWIKILFCNDI